jgi:branched-chain amino acid transport system ATP-binding protein
MSPGQALLSVRDLHAHYGKSHILQGVSFDVGHGEVVSLIGRNGSGRSTTAKAIMGLVKPTAGQILLSGRNLAGARPFLTSRAGIAFVPEEREIFSNLTVDENLLMGVQGRREKAPAWSTDQMFDYFPRLKERRNTLAGNLSGGEQQMLTICRSLLGNPRVILVDEPTEGLAPKIVTAVGEVIQDINRRGVAVILIEQKLTLVMKLCNSVCILGHGRIVFRGAPEELSSNIKLQKEWLAV